MAKQLTAIARTGRYVGFEDENGILNFLGIRYVRPPKRWKRAEPLPASDALIEAKEFGPICWQPLLPEEHTPDTPRSEDCLTLNIWTDSIETGGKPVMVWIHGGCYFTGSNRVPGYCNDRFAADCRDIVFVNINYRVGPFGGMDVSAFDPAGEYDESYNLQTYDQMAAIRWVHENIAAFGGDPDNITVYGQSAGSFSTATLLLIPECNRYIRRAICESSCFANTQKTLEISRKLGAEFARLAGASTLDELLALPPEKVLEYGQAIFDNPAEFPRPFEGVRDGKLIPFNPYEALRSGVAKHVTLMAGCVSGEYDTASFGQTDEALMAKTKELFGSRVSPENLEKYIHNDPDRDFRTALMDFRNDLAIRMPILCTLEAQAQSGAETYLYYFDYMPEGNTIRTQHLFEIPFFNDKLDIPMHMDETLNQPVQGNHPDPALVPQIQGCWASFARCGKPGGPHIGCDWPPYRMDDKETMVMTQGVWHVEKDFRAADTAITQPLMNE